MLCNHPLYRLLININIIRLFMCMYLKDYMYGLDIIGFFIYISQRILCIFVFIFIFTVLLYTHLSVQTAGDPGNH